MSLKDDTSYRMVYSICHEYSATVLNVRSPIRYYILFIFACFFLTNESTCATMEQ